MPQQHEAGFFDRRQKLDLAQPRLSGKWKSVFRHYFNLKHMETRLLELLAGGSFVPLGDYLRSRMAQGQLPMRPLA